MSTLSWFKIQSDYNRWTNSQLYEIAARIPPAERSKEMGTPYKSIHGTLNYLLLTDRLWLGRFMNVPTEFNSLAEELYQDYEKLKAERNKTDEQISMWVQALTDKDLDGKITFNSLKSGKEHSFRVADALLHFFHHQSYYKGQISSMISQLGKDFNLGEIDLMDMPGVELP